MKMNGQVIVIPELKNGNFASVIKMVNKNGGNAVLSSSPSSLKYADKVILAGVGSFDYAMKAINDEWIDPLNFAVFEQKIPILGICLGLHIMCKDSEEGELPGLGWIDAHVKRFKFNSEDNLKIPHMGWNTIEVIRNNPLLDRDVGEQRFYFAHSYYLECNDVEDIISVTDYGSSFASAIRRENIFGVQFHPEKSHRFGMSLINKFINFES